MLAARWAEEERGPGEGRPLLLRGAAWACLKIEPLARGVGGRELADLRGARRTIPGVGWHAMRHRGYHICSPREWRTENASCGPLQAAWEVQRR